jgi:16S rRNA (guanine966-N2)-methyltransferase
VRIVGGEFRGRPLAGPGSKAIRPTSDRLRETIFDILEHRYALPTDETRVLDLFAGTGALALEALSRGAASCLMVESSAEGRGLIRTNIEALAVAGRARVYRRDATDLGAVGTVLPFNLVFVDPPYGRHLGEAALAAAAKGDWLASGTICVVEESASAELDVPEGFTIVDEREIGDSRIWFLRWEPADAPRGDGI